MYEHAAKNGNWVHRLSTLAGLALTVVFFFLRGKMGTVRLVLFLLWMAIGVFSMVKVVSDAASGRHYRETNFENMLHRWEERTGSSSSALSSFWTITVLTAAVKLLVPFLLWFL